MKRRGPRIRVEGYSDQQVRDGIAEAYETEGGDLKPAEVEEYLKGENPELLRALLKSKPSPEARASLYRRLRPTGDGAAFRPPRMSKSSMTNIFFDENDELIVARTFARVVSYEDGTVFDYDQKQRKGLDPDFFPRGDVPPSQAFVVEFQFDRKNGVTGMIINNPAWNQKGKAVDRNDSPPPESPKPPSSAPMRTVLPNSKAEPLGARTLEAPSQLPATASFTRLRRLFAAARSR
jgi:hypothetical protein